MEEIANRIMLMPHRVFYVFLLASTIFGIALAYAIWIAPKIRDWEKSKKPLGGDKK